MRNLKTVHDRQRCKTVRDIASKAWALATLMALVIGLSPHDAFAGEPYFVAQDFETGDIGGFSDYLVDPDKTLTLDDIKVKPAEAWTRSTKPVPSFGFTKDVYWFRVSIHNTGPTERDLVAEIPYPLLDQIDLYLLVDKTLTTTINTGDRLPFSSRLIDHRNFLTPISIGSGQTAELYVRIETSGTVEFPLTLYDSALFSAQDQRISFGVGIYCGLMLVMALYNLALFSAIRRKSYLYYVIFALSFMLFETCRTGFAFQFLWPNWPAWGNVCIVLGVAGAVMGGVFFAIEFIELDKYTRMPQRMLRAGAVLISVISLSAFGLPYSLVMRAALLLALAMIVTCIALGLMVWRKGSEFGAIYCVAWIPFLICAVFNVFRVFGLVSPNVLSEYGMMIGSAAQVLILSLALAAQLDNIKRDKLQAERHSLDLRKQLTLSLHTKLQLLTNVAHELNNPLNHVSLGVDNLEATHAKLKDTVDVILSEVGSDPDAQSILTEILSHVENSQDILSGIHVGADRAAIVVREMRGLAEVDGRVVKDVLVIDLVESAMRRVLADLPSEQTSQVKVEKNFSSTSLVVGNPFVIAHALNCLLAGSMKRLTSTEEPTISMVESDSNGTLSLEISNNGPPLDAELAQHLFELDESRADYKNLAIAQALLVEQGGSLELSDAGSDTGWVKFKVTLAPSDL